MSEPKYIGSQVSKDTREVTDLTPAKPIPPTFVSRAEYEGFQIPVVNAFRAGLLPQSIQTEQAAIVVALKGRELGLEPMYALATIYLVNGRPGLEGEAMLALTRRRYPDVHVRWVELSHKKAVLEIGRNKETASTFTWDLNDAKRAGLITRINEDGTVVAAGGKEPWAKYTRKMLAWRVISEAITLLFPECIQGCLTRDELADKGVVRATEVVSAEMLDAQLEGEATPSVQSASHTPVSKQALEPRKENLKEKTSDILDAEFTDTVSTESTAPKFEPLPFETQASEYRFPAGQFVGKVIAAIPEEKLRAYLTQLKATTPSAQIKEMISAIARYLP